MYYAQVLKVSRALMWLAGILVAILGVIIAASAATGLYAMPLPSGCGTPIAALLAVASFSAAIFGSRFACTLSSENESHLAVAWTKPVSRARYVLSIMAVDAAGMTIAFAMTMAAMLAFIGSLRALSCITLPSDTIAQLARFLAFPLANYALLVAATASVGKGGRTIIGFAWVGSIVVAALGGAGLPHPWNQIFSTINLINPLWYAAFAYANASGDNVEVLVAGPHVQTLALTTDVLALVALLVAGVAVGIWQWKRVEA